MKVYYLSDLHNEVHERNTLLDYKGDTNGVLIVAGDINTKGRSLRDLEAVADRWQQIIAVPGNHDWWRVSLSKRSKFPATVNNVHFLLENSITIEGILFVGTTFWFPIPNYSTGYLWSTKVNDAKRIKGPGYSRLRGQDIDGQHSLAVRYLRLMKAQASETPSVLITHHAMSYKSVDTHFVGEETNQFYANNFEHLIKPYDFYIHGHIHQEKDYLVDNCHVLCNPYGYSRDGKKPFKLKSFTIGE